MNKFKKIIFLPSLILIFFVIFFTGFNVYAYFSTRAKVITNDGDSKYARVGMKLDLLFDRLNSGSEDLSTTSVTTTTTIFTEKYINNGITTEVDVKYNPNAEWGSKENPFVISAPRHLGNLSALQSIGYFNKLFNLNNQKQSFDKDNVNVPYFLVCKSDGTPTLIDCNKSVITPIGNEEFPFYGYVGGSFEEGNVTYEGNECNTSIIADVIVKVDKDQPDIGLFGKVGYLGDESNLIELSIDDELQVTTNFNGHASTITNLVLADVSINIVDPTPLEKYCGKLDHLFNYISKNSDNTINYDDDNLTYHENHHIGILVGHVEYSNISKISVYYSSNDIVALDAKVEDELEGIYANFLSCSGIIGFMYNMNPNMDIDTVTAGSGTSTNVGTSSGGGSGSGGGLLSGTGRGYLTAAEIFDLYDDDGLYVANYTYKGFDYYGIIVQKVGNNYYLMDGTTQVTMTKDSNISISEPYQNFWGFTEYTVTTWTDFIVKDGDKYYFRGNPEKEVPTTDIANNTLVLRYAHHDGAGTEEDPDEDLCTEYVRSRLIAGTQNSGHYYFYDGVFTFCLSDNSDTIEDTWPFNNVDSFTIGNNNDTDWKANYSKGNNKVVAVIKPIVGTDELDAAISSGKKVFIGYHDDYTNATSMVGSTTYMMSLNSSDTSGGFFDFQERTLESIAKNNCTDDEKLSIIQSLSGGEVIPQTWISTNKDAYMGESDISSLITNISNNNYHLLNLGSAQDMDTLIEQFTITPTKNNNYYNFFGTNSGYYLSLLHRYFKFIIGNDNFSIWSGNSAPTASTCTYYYSNNVSVVFKGSDYNPYFSISITSDSPRYANLEEHQTRYIRYNEQLFRTSTTETKMYLYTLEAYCNLNYGRITFDPKDSTGYEFNCDEYVLWPNQTYTGGNTGNSTYTVKSLNELYNADNGWINKSGQKLTKNDLHKKFTMKEALQFAIQISIGNGNLGSDGYIVAPVGSLGVEANIPLGCVAFRINAGGTRNIRVIVSVPQSDYYQGEDRANSGFYSSSYYFGVWAVESNGESIISSFNANDCLEKFELPRSNKYEPSASPNSTNSNYILTNYNGVEYRSYLNGDHVLVAYTFEVTSENGGVYILGTTGCPMEVVYFSADGTSSEGRDGVSGSKIGDIDFVYDYNGKIVTVSDTNVVAGTGENYNNYYSSLSLLYTDNALKESNKYVDINNFKIYIQRIVDSSTGEEKSKIKMNVLSSTNSKAQYIQIRDYTMDEIGDELETSYGTR